MTHWLAVSIDVNGCARLPRRVVVMIAAGIVPAGQVREISMLRSSVKDHPAPLRLRFTDGQLAYVEVRRATALNPRYRNWEQQAGLGTGKSRHRCRDR